MTIKTLFFLFAFSSVCLCAGTAQDPPSAAGPGAASATPQPVVPASEQAPAAAPAAAYERPAPDIAGADTRVDFARLRADVEETVAKLDELRGMRDAADGPRRAELEEEVGAVYEHLDELRRKVADMAVQTESLETQRRLEAERQQHMITRNNNAVQQRIFEQQQRVRQQQEQQMRLSRQPR